MRISDWSSDVCSSDLTGFAPLRALDYGPRNLVFLGRLIRQLVTPVGGQLGVTQERMIDEGLASLGRLAPEDRSILALRQLLGQRDPEGIGARLEKWADRKSTRLNSRP